MHAVATSVIIATAENTTAKSTLIPNNSMTSVSSTVTACPIGHDCSQSTQEQAKDP